MANKRIYDLSTATDLTGQFITVDKSGNSESEKIGAEGLNFYTKVTVSSAEILQLNSTPKQLVASPGAGKIIAFQSMIIDYNFISAAYATNTDMQLINGTTLNQQWLDVNSIIAGASDTIINNIAEGAAAGYAQTLQENESLLLSVENGNPTTGDGTVTVYLWYKILTL